MSALHRQQTGSLVRRSLGRVVPSVARPVSGNDSRIAASLGIVLLTLLVAVPAHSHRAAAAAPVAPPSSVTSSSAPAWSTASDASTPSVTHTPPRRAASRAVLVDANPPDGLGLPQLVFQAYRSAATALANQDPGCHLPWWLLAGIGHTESGNAEGGRVTPDGTTRGRILGPRLDGSIPGDAIIRDTDHGVLDGDKVYDRAVGPMQFIPSTWRAWGGDGNGDGKADPNNIFDAALTAGHYLCAGGRDLATTAGIAAAILSYNHSQAYLDTVLAWGHAYRDGAISVADSSLPVVTDVTKVRPPLSSRPQTRATNRSGKGSRTSGNPAGPGTDASGTAPSAATSTGPHCASSASTSSQSTATTTPDPAGATPTSPSSPAAGSSDAASGSASPAAAASTSPSAATPADTSAATSSDAPPSGAATTTSPSGTGCPS